ncbi:MAG: hypothetical protein M3378_04670 [Actinomycetota bacterium]|nr:hypothetical protein [Actinomycetota bacterium]
MIERLPERVRTPAVARAVTSPSAVLLAGAGMSAAVLAGLPLAAAAAVGALAWGARVALAVPRRAKGDRIDPSAVRPPWRDFVRDALKARDRFSQAVRRSRPGPLRDRLGDIERRLDQAVTECWRIARQGDSLEGAVGQLRPDAVRAELAEIRAERAGAEGESRASLDRAEEAVKAQLASVERLERVARDARSRLRALDAQLDEAVAQAVELSVSSADTSQLTPLAADVDSVVGELESLRQALEETSGPPGTGRTA